LADNFYTPSDEKLNWSRHHDLQEEGLRIRRGGDGVMIELTVTMGSLTERYHLYFDKLYSTYQQKALILALNRLDKLHMV
jgi:hypothetical protein